MNTLRVVSNLLLLSVVFLNCYSIFGRGQVNPSYIYLFTEDAQLGKFGKLPLEYNGRCQNEFFPRSYSHLVIVEQTTGILKLTQPLHLLRTDEYGIRTFTTNILVVNQCSVYKSPPKARYRKIIRVSLIIFPYNFGDRFLERYSYGRIAFKFRHSNAFKGTAGSNSLHRFVRLVGPKIERKAFNQMIASIRVKKTLEVVINEIVTKYVNAAKKHVYYSWYLNSLFSRTALNQLAKNSGCTQNKVVKCPKNAEYRTVDGTCNNLRNPLFGSAPKPLKRLLPARYYDPEGLNDPLGMPGQANFPDIPTTFKVVREFIIQQNSPSDYIEINSHALMQFGQFMDHDVSLTPESQSSDNCQEVRCDKSHKDYSVPCYTIQSLGKHRCIRMARAASQCQIQNGRITTRQQINVNTAFLDGSQVYGSTHEMAKNLRDLTNDKGLLKTQPGVNGDLLSADHSELMAPNSFCKRFGGCYLAGDTRSSEHTLLAAMHTLFVREHNRIARALRKLNPHWNGEKIYQETRKIIGAVLQKITYEDFLPIIIGKPLPNYKGYNPKVNPDVINSFSTAAFRFGHSQIRPSFDKLDANYNPIGYALPLRHLFFNNTYIKKHGIDELTLGLLSNSSQGVDRKLAVGILNHLYERPHSPGLNLAAINIQRGRDHGLPGYNAFRRLCGLESAKTFEDTYNEISIRRNRRLLAKLYNNQPEHADLWVAGIAETPANCGIVGPTFGCIIRKQMTRIRDGDRYFYMNKGVFSQQQLNEIRKTTLSRIMCDNLRNIVSIQKNAFISGKRSSRRTECGNIPGIDLRAWQDYYGKYGH